MPRGGRAYWWAGNRHENVWMEITRRPDIGGDLEAPVAARGGAKTAGYALVPLVRSGDIVVHYDSASEALVGASLVVGDPEPTATYWAARGTSARRARAAPSWLPGLRVPLAHYSPLVPEVPLDELRRRERRLMAVRSSLEARHGKAPLYFPWVPYPGQSMRTFQSYLAKLPQAAIDVVPGLRDLVTTVAASRALELAPQPEAAAAEAAVADAARVRRQGRGQSFQLDQQVKVAVEVHAMNEAVRHYARAWTVEDVHGTESYDLRCTNGATELHVEVKGTITAGNDVLLTPNEVVHARTYPHVALFVVVDIVVERDADGQVTARGGRRVVFDPWHIDGGALRPLGYRYALPATQSA